MMGSKTEFANKSLNLPKIRKLNIDPLIISQGLLIHEKTRVEKSHATVPLILMRQPLAYFSLLSGWLTQKYYTMTPTEYFIVGRC